MRFTALALLSWELQANTLNKCLRHLYFKENYALCSQTWLGLSAENIQHESHIWVDKLGTGSFNCQVNDWRQSRLYRALGPNHTFSTDTCTLRLRFLSGTQG